MLQTETALRYRSAPGLLAPEGAEAWRTPHVPQQRVPVSSVPAGRGTLHVAQELRATLDCSACWRLSARLHGITDEGIPVRDIASVIGRHLSLPIEEAATYFGWFGFALSRDCPASSTQTQQRMGWQPVQPSLLEDLEQGYYFTQGQSRSGRR